MTADGFDRARVPQPVTRGLLVAQAIEALGARYGLEPTSAWYLILSTAQSDKVSVHRVADDVIHRCG